VPASTLEHPPYPWAPPIGFHPRPPQRRPCPVAEQRAPGALPSLA